ncbi:hypothetical protein [Serratia liquefaciens]|uniref:hypothetical protein n=1 Tax=Serratia liquefaciens TaxID=614 RepID=UPI0013EE3ED0|nr:hypothetical protein [Serratia liquefaciens]
MPVPFASPSIAAKWFNGRVTFDTPWWLMAAAKQLEQASLATSAILSLPENMEISS